MGYASWDPRGFYHYHERLGGRYISKERFLSLLRPSKIGYHGYLGRLIPFKAMAQILGAGEPTDRHLWWRQYTERPQPVGNVRPRGNQQFFTQVTYVDAEGRQSSRRFYTKIGKGYDRDREAARIASWLAVEETPPVEELPEEWKYTEVSRSFTEVNWQLTMGVGPAEEDEW